jgi:hypothetical protein
VGGEELHSAGLVALKQHLEGVAQGTSIAFILQMLHYDIGAIWYYLFPERPVQDVNAENGVTPHIRHSVPQASRDSGHKWLLQFTFTKLAQKPQSGSAKVLVGMGQLVAQGIATKWDTASAVFGVSAMLREALTRQESFQVEAFH